MVDEGSERARKRTAKVDLAALRGEAGEARKLFDELRAKGTQRRTLSGEETCEFSVPLKVVTPILGGGPKLRDVDRVDIIRVPTVRGHLRFWWRALYGHLYDCPRKLYEAESALWGHAADAGSGGRSEVEVLIPEHSQHRNQDLDTSNPLDDPCAYALWPARVQGAGNNGHLPRRRPGTATFALRVVGPKGSEQQLQNAVRAWILFGGYGSRTRRGLGSLTVEGDDWERKSWLPNLVADEHEKPTAEELASNLFGMSHFKARILRPERDRNGRDLPQLSNARLYADLEASTGVQPGWDAISAWTAALGWLRSFRQAVPTGARRPGAGHPGQSNWPEADKIRHHHGGGFTHPARPQHTAVMAWPRAGFGLPIVGEGHDHNEPGEFTLRWKSTYGQHDRLASALILKALPLANGNFLPCALWLDRGFPDNSAVGIEADIIENGKTIKGVKPGTEAPFHRNVPMGPGIHPLLAPGDTPLFAPLSQKATIRDAFCDWLSRPAGPGQPPRAVKIAP